MVVLCEHPGPPASLLGTCDRRHYCSLLTLCLPTEKKRPDVHKDQTCGVPGRYIGENVALPHDVVYYCTSFDVPVAVLSLDQEKAFDRVDWDCMRSTLSIPLFLPLFLMLICFTIVLRALLTSMVICPLFSV